MAIPKVIHQTWRTESVPEELVPCVSSWDEKNPGWRRVLWTHERMDAFVREHYPDLHPFYSSYPADIFRADLFRLLVLDRLGGVYVDLDMECLRGLDELLERYGRGAGFCVAKRPAAFARRYGVPVYIQNFFIAAEPGGEIVRRLIRDVVRRGSSHPVEDVVSVTGPLGVTESLCDLDLDSLVERGDVSVLDEAQVGVLVNVVWDGAYADGATRRMARDTVRMLLSRQFPEEAYMVHYFHGTYARGKPMLLMSREELLALDRRLVQTVTVGARLSRFVGRALGRVDRLFARLGFRRAPHLRRAWRRAWRRAAFVARFRLAPRLRRRWRRLALPLRPSRLRRLSSMAAHRLAGRAGELLGRVSPGAYLQVKRGIKPWVDHLLNFFKE